MYGTGVDGTGVDGAPQRCRAGRIGPQRLEGPRLVQADN
jgi:hypothetical protein